MKRATISRRALERLIRAKLATTPDCKGVRPLPVAWRQRERTSCNWALPGWTGNADEVRRCTARMRSYLQFLRSQFDIPEQERQ